MNGLVAEMPLLTNMPTLFGRHYASGYLECGTNPASPALNAGRPKQP